MLQVSTDGALRRGMRLELLSTMAKRIVKKRTRQRLRRHRHRCRRNLMQQLFTDDYDIHLSVDPNPRPGAPSEYLGSSMDQRVSSLYSWICSGLNVFRLTLAGNCLH